MKNLLFLFIALISITGFAQETPKPNEDGKIIYSIVEEVAGSKDMLYGNAKIWFADAFKSAQDVIQVDDKELGVVLGKGKYITGPEIWEFTIKIQVKDNKYKADIYDIARTYVSSPTYKTYYVLDEEIHKERNYKSSGEMKGWFSRYTETANSFSYAFLEDIKKTMSHQITVDDF